MKFTLFILAYIISLFYCEIGYAQNVKVGIVGQNLQVEQILVQIEEQTDYLFVYNKKNIDLKRIINLDASSKTVTQLLDVIFAGTDITYLMEGKNIVLTRQSTLSPPATPQRISIRGTITDESDIPIIGANIIEKGTSNGTITDLEGKFSFEVAPKSSIITSFIGYKTQVIPISGRNYFTIKLSDESHSLDSIVVTAMGLKKKETSLTYATQQFNNDEVTRVKDPNMITALAGKASGVQINRSSSGLGGSARVIIRGNRSVNGNNQPLYVLDGIPMSNTILEQAVTVIGGTDDAGNRDSGDGISNLNPDDIESISILKGPSAAALYGSQSANGVILITTKKGKPGIQKVSFSSTLTVDQAISLPKLQDQYGYKDNMSWGDKTNLPMYDNTGEFFKNGLTTINTVSLQNGGEKTQTYFSYGNTTAKGIIEENKLQKHNLNFHETSSFFNDYLKLDANVNLMYQTIKNRPTPGGFYMNPLVGLYRFPRGKDITEYKTNFEVFDQERNMPVQNWHITDLTGEEQNPFWLTKRVNSNEKRIRAIASLTANIKITNWLSIQGRGSVDYTNDKFRQSMAATTAPAIAGSNPENGRYIDLKNDEFLLYADAMAIIDKKWQDYTLYAAIGGSVNSNTINTLRIDSKSASLYYANQFSVGNIILNQNAALEEATDTRRVIQSVFSTAQIGWKARLYLDITARNDWASTLTYTEKLSFFYPSVGLSWIINKSINLPEWVSFAKIRGSWAHLGNDLPLFVSNPYETVGAGGKIIAVDAAPYEKLKPEISSSWEIGTEWKFLSNRLDVDFTCYKTNTKNQLLKLSSTAGAYYRYYYVNSGNIENKGLEISLGIIPVLTKDIYWKSNFNFFTNKNKIVKLHSELKSFIYGDDNFSSSYAMRLKEGGSFGDIYGVKFDRDENGTIKINNNGEIMTLGKGNTELVGNLNPDCSLGWSNVLSYKDFTLDFLIDFRFGGDILSQTQADLDKWGTSKMSEHLRDLCSTNGYFNYGGQHFYDAEIFFNKVGGREGITEYYMYDATNIRLRELSLSYNFPSKYLQKTKIIQTAQLSFVGRNLFFFYKNAPFDPDAVLSTDNNCQGIDVYGMPTTRSLGFNIKVTF